jgi:hypothetical protein
MKSITITVVSGKTGAWDILIKPGTTTADILKALKLPDYVLVPLSNPDRVFSKKDDLYPKLSECEDLCAINSTAYYLYF